MQQQLEDAKRRKGELASSIGSSAKDPSKLACTECESRKRKYEEEVMERQKTKQLLEEWNQELLRVYHRRPKPA